MASGRRSGTGRPRRRTIRARSSRRRSPTSSATSSGPSGGTRRGRNDRSRRMVSGLATGRTTPPRGGLRRRGRCQRVRPTQARSRGCIDGAAEPARRHTVRPSVQGARGRPSVSHVEHGREPLRPARRSRTTMRCWLRETTSVTVAVQEPPRLSVMLIGVPRGSSASAATSGPSSTAPQPSSSLQGLQPARGCLFGASESTGNSRSSAAAMTSRA